MSLSGFIVFIVVVGFAVISSFVKKKMPENPNLKHNNPNNTQHLDNISLSDDIYSGMLKNSREPHVNEECEFIWNAKITVNEEPEEDEIFEEEVAEAAPPVNVIEQEPEYKAVNCIEEKKVTDGGPFKKPSSIEEWRHAIVMHEILKTKF